MIKIKILIVDDEEEIRVYLKEAFIAKGFEVLTANDGIEGLENALNEKPQLILADVKMPRLDGIGMLKKIRSSGEWGKKVPVMILTNFDTDESNIQDLAEGEPSFYFLKAETDPDIIIDKFKEIAKL